VRFPSVRFRLTLLVPALLGIAACQQSAPAASTVSASVFKPVDVPNVVRDPADVPQPLAGRGPTTVVVTMTVKEVVSDITAPSPRCTTTFRRECMG